MSQENDRQLPDGWQWVKLGDVCELIMGQSPPSSSYINEPRGLPFFQGKADFGKISPIPRFWCFEPIKIAEVGDILISVRAPVGPTNIVDVQCCIGRGLAAIRPNQDSERDFIHAALRLYENKLVSLGSGSTFEAIGRKDLETLKIPLPPLSEQKRIAAILNEQMEAVEKARKATEAQLEAAKALPAAYLRAVFESEEANSWERRKLGDVCRVTKLAGFEYTKYVNYNPDGKYIALRAQNVRNTGLDLSNFVKITEDVASYLSRSKLDSGDIVMTFIGANIGEATWIDKNDMFYCAPNIARITPNAELIDCQFLTRLIHSSEFQRQIRDINESTAQQSLSMKNIRDFWVVFPTLSQQKQIASTLTEQMQEVERLKQNLKEQLDTINKLPAVLS